MRDLRSRAELAGYTEAIRRMIEDVYRAYLDTAPICDLSFDERAELNRRIRRARTEIGACVELIRNPLKGDSDGNKGRSRTCN